MFVRRFALRYNHHNLRLPLESDDGTPLWQWDAVRRHLLNLSNPDMFFRSAMLDARQEPHDASEFLNRLWLWHKASTIFCECPWSEHTVVAHAIRHLPERWISNALLCSQPQPFTFGGVFASHLVKPHWRIIGGRTVRIIIGHHRGGTAAGRTPPHAGQRGGRGSKVVPGQSEAAARCPRCAPRLLTALDWQRWRHNGATLEVLCYLSSLEARRAHPNTHVDDHTALQALQAKYPRVYHTVLDSLDVCRAASWSDVRNECVKLALIDDPDVFFFQAIRSARQRSHESLREFMTRVYRMYRASTWLGECPVPEHQLLSHIFAELRHGPPSISLFACFLRERTPKPFTFPPVLAALRETLPAAMVHDQTPASAAGASLHSKEGTLKEGTPKEGKASKGRRGKRRGKRGKHMCFRCGRQGHQQQRCPEPFRCCFTCHRPGHRAAECPRAAGSNT